MSRDPPRQQDRQEAMRPMSADPDFDDYEFEVAIWRAQSKRRQIEAASQGLAAQQAQPSVGSSTDQPMAHSSAEGQPQGQASGTADQPGRSCQSDSTQSWCLQDTMKVQDYEESEWAETLIEAALPDEDPADE